MKKGVRALGAQGNAGGEPGKPNSNSNGNDGGNTGGNEPPKQYSKEFVDRLMNERKNATERAQSAEQRLNDIEAQKKLDEENRLKEQGKFKDVAEQKQKEIDALKAENEATKKQIEDSRKLSAFLETIDGDLKRNYWSLVDLDSIKLDDQGRPTEETLSEAAKNFQTQYPEIIGQKGGPNLQNGGGEPPKNKTITYEEWKKLPAKEMGKRMKDVEGFPAPTS